MTCIYQLDPIVSHTPAYSCSFQPYTFYSPYDQYHFRDNTDYSCALTNCEPKASLPVCTTTLFQHLFCSSTFTDPHFSRQWLLYFDDTDGPPESPALRRIVQPLPVALPFTPFNDPICATHALLLLTFETTVPWFHRRKIFDTSNPRSLPFTIRWPCCIMRCTICCVTSCFRHL